MSELPPQPTAPSAGGADDAVQNAKLTQVTGERDEARALISYLVASLSADGTGGQDDVAYALSTLSTYQQRVGEERRTWVLADELAAAQAEVARLRSEQGTVDLAGKWKAAQSYAALFSRLTRAVDLLRKLRAQQQDAAGITIELEDCIDAFLKEQATLGPRPAGTSMLERAWDALPRPVTDPSSPYRNVCREHLMVALAAALHAPMAGHTAIISREQLQLINSDLSILRKTLTRIADRCAAEDSHDMSQGERRAAMRELLTTARGALAVVVSGS